jgi:O-antigen/teichoic acid export membrane protein
MQWFNAIMFLPTVSGRVVLPMLTGYVTSENSADSKKLLLLAMRANALIAFPMALVIAVVSPWILSLYGPGFSRGAPVLIVAVFTAALLGVQSPVGNMVAAVSRMWLGMLMNIGWACVYIGVAFWTVTYGALGIAVAMCSAYIAHSIWTFTFAMRQVRSLSIAQGS